MYRGGAAGPSPPTSSTSSAQHWPGREREKAAHQFGLALELELELAPAHYALGTLRQLQRRVSEALKHWREAARLAPKWPIR